MTVIALPNGAIPRDEHWPCWVRVNPKEKQHSESKKHCQLSGSPACIGSQAHQIWEENLSATLLELRVVARRQMS
jgi:hypothetical protein